MALAFRTNGAPLSGALFVSNPKNRQARRSRTRKSTRSASARTNARTRKARSNGTKARKIRKVRKAKARTNGAKARPNTRKVRKVRRVRRSLKARTNGRKTVRRTRRVRVKRNTAPVKARANRRVSRRAARRNTAPRRYYFRKARRNNGEGGGGGSLGFRNRITNAAAALVAKVPVLGGLFSSVAAPLIMGAAVGGVHYGAVKLLQSVAPGVLGAVNPVKFTVVGAVVATLLRSGLPGINKIPADFRNQLATGALVVGGGLDAFRYLTREAGDLGEAVSLYDYSDAVPLYPYSGLGVDLGDGGAYDVVPMYGNINAGAYAGAREGDAMYVDDDLAVDEGEAALAGISAWRQTFGAEPRIQSQTAGYYSALAGQPGHRWGWLIKLVGFEKFQQIAALPPMQRQAFISQLRAQALALADAQAAQPQAPLTPAQGGRPVNTTPTPMAGIGMDFGSPLYAGSAYSGAF
jgi:hypothetical protein